MQRLTNVLVLILIASALAPGFGCSKQEAAAPPPATARPPPDLKAAMPPAAATKPVAPPAAPAYKITGTNEEAYTSALAQVELYRQEADFAAAANLLVDVQAAFPAHAEDILNLMAGLKVARRDAANLNSAVDQLGKAEQTIVTEAVRALADGGDTAKILLRKAVRDRENIIVAGAAAGILGDLRDPKAFPLILARLLKDPTATTRAPLLAALAKLAATVPASAAAPLLPLTRDDKAFKQRDVVAVLGAVLDKGCGGDAAKFDQELQAPGAAAGLKEYIQAAMVAEDEDVRTWATLQAETFKAYLPGIRGQYFEGCNFEKQLFERLDDKINVADRQFPFPDGRQDNISVRWSGKLLLLKDGAYTFAVASDDGNRMWVDDKKLFDDWGSPCNHRATVELKKGLHDVKIEFQQGGGGAWITATWTGPDSPEKPLDKEILRVIPWQGAAPAKP